MAKTKAATRIGGHAVAESLAALGAEVVFGIPGVHALPIWEGLRTTELRVLGFRQELNAGFAADGHARVTGRPTPLVVSTGPGAFMTLAPLMEAFTAFVPLVVVSSQIRLEGIGQGRGHLHETPDQSASFAPLVNGPAERRAPSRSPWSSPMHGGAPRRRPRGPVYVEVPYDILLREAGDQPVGELDGSPEPRATPPRADLDRAATLLEGAERPLIVAGGGAVRSGASAELLELASRLDAPVATTYTGKGAFPERHELAVGSAWDDAVHRQLVSGADVVLVVGSWLGYDVTDGFRLRLDGTLIQIDAAAERIGLNLPAFALPGDAKATLQALLDRIDTVGQRDGPQRAGRVRASVERGLNAQSQPLSLEVLAIVDDALPEGARRQPGTRRSSPTPPAGTCAPTSPGGFSIPPGRAPSGTRGPPLSEQRRRSPTGRSWPSRATAASSTASPSSRPPSSTSSTRRCS